MNKILIVDGSQLIYSSLFKFQSKNTDLNYSGVKTGIIHGFFLQIFSFITKFNPNLIIVCWDSKYSFRRDIFKNYKKQRRERKDLELIKIAKKQIFNIAVMLQDIGIFSISYRGLEADDLIAICSNRYKEKYKVIVVTTDSDLLQVIDDNVSIYDQRKKKIKDLKWLKREYDITPDDWIMVKAIGGCRSDNIPGIKGISEETAIKFLSGKEIKQHLFDKIANSKEEILFSYRLVKLPFKNVEFPILFLPPNKKKFILNCKKYGLRKVMEKGKELFFDE